MNKSIRVSSSFFKCLSKDPVMRRPWHRRRRRAMCLCGSASRHDGDKSLRLCTNGRGPFRLRVLCIFTAVGVPPSGGYASLQLVAPSFLLVEDEPFFVRLRFSNETLTLQQKRVVTPRREKKKLAWGRAMETTHTTSPIGHSSRISPFSRGKRQFRWRKKLSVTTDCSVPQMQSRAVLQQSPPSSEDSSHEPVLEGEMDQGSPAAGQQSSVAGHCSSVYEGSTDYSGSSPTTCSSSPCVCRRSRACHDKSGTRFLWSWFTSAIAFFGYVEPRYHPECETRKPVLRGALHKVLAVTCPLWMSYFWPREGYPPQPMTDPCTMVLVAASLGSFELLFICSTLYHHLHLPVQQYYNLRRIDMMTVSGTIALNLMVPLVSLDLPIHWIMYIVIWIFTTLALWIVPGRYSCLVFGIAFIPSIILTAGFSVPAALQYMQQEQDVWLILGNLFAFLATMLLYVFSDADKHVSSNPWHLSHWICSHDFIHILSLVGFVSLASVNQALIADGACQDMTRVVQERWIHAPMLHLV